MKTLAEINNDLDSILLDLNLNSPEIQSLKLFISNSIYQNEALGTSISLESNPLTCIHVNSAIMHAAANKYKVFRGKNPRVTIVGLIPTADFSVKKYDVFLEIDGYQLVYAEDYNFKYRENPNDYYAISLILTKEVVSGKFDALNIYSYDLKESVSEDIMLYDIVGDDMQIIPLNSKVNADDSESVVYQLTISDYGVKFLSLSKFVNQGTHYYKYLPLIEDEVDLSKILNSISRVANFDSANLTIQQLQDAGYWGIWLNRIVNNPILFNEENLPFWGVGTRVVNGDIVEQYESLLNVMDKESDLDEIFLHSITSANSGVTIKSTSDLDKVVATLTFEYYSKVKCTVENDELHVYYLLKDSQLYPNRAWLTRVASEIKKVYYNQSLIISENSFIPANTLAFTNVDIHDVSINYSSPKLMDSEIQNTILNYQVGILGGTFNPYELLFHIQSKLGGDLTYLGPGMDTASKEFFGTTYSLGNNLTIDLSSIKIVRL